MTRPPGGTATTRPGSRWRKRTFAVVMATFATVSTAWAGEPPPHPVQILMMRAVEDPFDEERFEALLRVLPRDGGDYILEGDIALTRDEVREYLVSRAGATAGGGIRPELVVGLHEGSRDFYGDHGQRVLSYRIERGTFPDSATSEFVAGVVRDAASEWERICPECGLDFVEETDPSISLPWPSFRVVHHDASRAYIARAFFPHDPEPDREVRIDPSFFRTRFDRVGVLRHELGHVLGYRHEHIRNISGCFGEGGEWHPLTPYDPHSVMHYFCGGGGSMRLEITEIDRVGHINLYLPGTAESVDGVLAPRTEPSVSLETTVAARPAPAPLPAAAAPTAAGETGSGSTDQKGAYRQAVSSPFDEVKRSIYLQSLPRAGEFYVVEGDVPKTEEEMLAYLVARSRASVNAGPQSGLLVGLHDGRPNIYPADPLAARRLSYAIDRWSFPDDGQYASIVRAMGSAGRSWEEVCFECGVRFVHVAAADAAPESRRVNFVVRLDQRISPAMVLAFSPHDPPNRRVIRVHPRIFDSPFTPEAVLRHVLGHALGYEHIPPGFVTQCRASDGRRAEPVSSVTQASVMQAFCGDETGIDVTLTPLDHESHSRFYATPYQIIVQLEGGDATANAVRVLGVLSRVQPIPTREIEIKQGDTVEGLASLRLGLPPGRALFDLARQYNKGLVSGSLLRIGSTLRIPDVLFTRYTFGRRFDTRDAEDRNQLKDMRANWSHLLEKGADQRLQKEPGIVRVSIVGFRLRYPVQDGERLERMIAAVNGLRSANIIVAGRTPKSDMATLHGCSPCPKKDARQFWAERTSSPVAAPMQGSLRLMLAWEGSVTSNQRCDQSAQDSECPEVVIVDTPVSPHADLEGALIAGPGYTGSPILMDDGTQHFVSRDNLPETEHGTHLAGIIGARDNEFGFSGIDPEAQIYSWNWEILRNDPDLLVQRILDQEESASPRNARTIYLFATEWDTTAFRPENVVNDEPISHRIVEEKALVIAASGQPPGGAGTPVDITASYAKGPMNLGTLENVIVVTACDPCEGTHATIAPWANYSTGGLVHLAAPGRDIPSTIGRDEYAIASGTSQAAAFVAGAASLMASAFPNSYDDSKAVKLRLQLTATPFPTGGGNLSARRVAAGILNLERALLDPKRHWAKPNGAPFVAVADDLHWTVESITGNEALGTARTISLRSVRRIARTEGGYVFFLETQRRGEIERIGPLRFTPDRLTRAIIAAAASTIADGVEPPLSFQLADIEDLILSRKVHTL